MNTKGLMTASSLVLGLAGVVAIFIPQELAKALGLVAADPLPDLIQLMGALYFAFAFLNWTAKESVIGGIYSRPISLGNFAHFFIGTVVLAKNQLSNGITPSIFVALIIYAGFAILFSWLVFWSSGIPKSQSGTNP